MTIARIASHLVLVAPQTSALAAGDDPPGQAVYLRYCGACYGPEGKGDGVAGYVQSIQEGRR